MKIQYAVIFWTLSSIAIFGQADNRSYIQIGYHGDVIFHPGVKVSYLKPVTTWTKDKANKTKIKSLLIGSELAYYYNANHHHGLILGPNFSYRRIKKNGKYIQWSIMLGLHRSIVDGSTYEVSSEKVINKIGFAGQTALYNSMSFQFGKKITNDLGYYAEVGLNGRTPYNNSYLTGIHIGIGFQYSINK